MLNSLTSMNPRFGILLSSAFILFFLPASASAATLYWVGGNGDSVNTNANDWSTSNPAACNDGGGDAGAVPGASDIAVFDADCDNNAVIDSAWSVAGINLNSGYTGTVTQNNSVTLTVGTSGWTHAGGTFAGGDSTIDLNGSFTLSAGIFTSTSGTMDVLNNWTHTSGGTFNHNLGSIISSAVSATWDFDTSETFYNFERNCDGGGNCGTSQILTIASGDTAIVTGTFTHDDGAIATGTIEAQGDVVIESSSNGTTASLTFTGTADQTITGNGGTTLSLNINKTSGILTAEGSFTITNVTISSGTFTSTSDILTVKGNWTHTSGGTFNHNLGSIISSAVSATWDFDTSETFYNFERNCDGGGNCGTSQILTIASGDTAIVTGTFTHDDGAIATGTIEAQGDVVIESSSNGTTASLTFTGTGAQTYTDNGGTIMTGSPVLIDKPSGTLTLATDATFNNAGQDLTLSGGTLNLAGYDLTVNDQFVIQNDATLQLHGDETITGGPDSISSTSTVIYTGDGDIAEDTYTVDSLATTYGNLTIESKDGDTDTFKTTQALDVDGKLTISGGSLLHLNNNNLDLTGGSFTNTGTLALLGGETLTAFTNHTSSGTIKYTGTGTYTSLPTGNSYYNLTIDSSGGSFTPDANTDINNVFTLSQGTFAQGTNKLNIAGNTIIDADSTFTKSSNGSLLILDGDLTLELEGSTPQNLGNLQIGTSPDTTTLSGNLLTDTLTVGSGDTLIADGYNIQSGAGGITNSGTLTLTAGNGGTTSIKTSSGFINHGTTTAGDSTLTLSGSFINKGTFTANTGSLVLNGTGQTLSGSTTFYNLTKTTSTEDTLTFSASDTFTIKNTATLQGEVSNLLSLRSSTDGTEWIIDPQVTREISYVDVKDSNNTNSTVIDPSGSTDSGNNTNWFTATSNTPTIITTQSSGGGGRRGTAGRGGRAPTLMQGTRRVDPSERRERSERREESERRLPVWTDFDQSHPHAPAALTLFQHNILRGYDDNTIKLDHPLSRIEALTLLMRTHGYRDRPTIPVPFPDVSIYSWYSQPLRSALFRGFIQGYSDNTFRPSQTLTLVQALKFISIALNLATQDQEAKETTERWYDPYVSAGREAGLISGEINPNRDVSRGEFAAWLVKVLVQ